MVNIIVPIYNSELFLTSCIDSVLNQNYSNFRLILVDDGSLDGSANICKSYSDSRIFYIRKDNGGVSSARNVGLKELKSGEFVTFLDSDDYLPNDAIQKLVNSLEESGADFTIGSFTHVYGDTFNPHSMRIKPGKYDTTSLLPYFLDDGTLSGFLLGSVCATLYRTDVIVSNDIKFDEKIRNNEDGLFNMEFAIHANNLNVIDSCVYYYRQISNSGSTSRNKGYDYNSLIINKLRSLPWNLDGNDFENQVKARNVSLALWDILLYPRNLNLKDGYCFIRERVSRSEVKEGLPFIKYRQIPFYKRVFAYLIRFRQSLLLYLVVRYAYPLLKGKIKR